MTEGRTHGADSAIDDELPASDPMLPIVEAMLDAMVPGIRKKFPIPEDAPDWRQERQTSPELWDEHYPILVAAARAALKAAAVSENATLPMVEVSKRARDFQDRVQPWMMACFGAEISADLVERTDRATEEMLELSQAICSMLGIDFAPRAHALVDYVAGRPAGDPAQEVGGVMVTLAALCLAAGLNMHDAAETELSRIMRPEIIEKIRAKQAAKPTGSALPIALADTKSEAAMLREAIARIIEPIAFEQPTKTNNRVYRNWSYEQGREDAYAKADAILALTTPNDTPVRGLVEAVERFLADYDDGDRADAGVNPLMEAHVRDFRAALSTAKEQDNG